MARKKHSYYERRRILQSQYNLFLLRCVLRDQENMVLFVRTSALVNFWPANLLSTFNNNNCPERVAQKYNNSGRASAL